MTNPPLTLTFSVARPDAPFIAEIIPHLVRAVNSPDAEVDVVVDTKPLPARYGKKAIPSLEQTIAICEDLKKKGIVHRVIDIPYDKHTVSRVCRKWFGRGPLVHNFRGAPIYGYVYALEVARGPRIAHFDSDILFHDSSREGYLALASEALMIDECLFAAPRPGPPDAEGQHLKQHGVGYKHDERGYFVFDRFTSRRYVVDKARLESILPLTPYSVSRKLWLGSLVGLSSPWASFEMMVSRTLERGPLRRFDLDRPDCWALHTPDHGERFLKHLPDIIPLVEKGLFPPEQANDYDLNLDAWIPFIEAKRREGVIK